MIDIVSKKDGKKKEGTALIRNLIGHKNTLTINLAIRKGKDGKTYAMIGGATGATDDSKKNDESNGKGTDVSTQIGEGHPIFGETSGGSIRQEELSMTDLLNHELVHAFAQMNGEARRDGTANNTYRTDKKETKREVIPKEEAATLGIVPRPSPKGIYYTNENLLRNEQGKSTRLNYIWNF